MNTSRACHSRPCCRHFIAVHFPAIAFIAAILLCCTSAGTHTVFAASQLPISAAAQIDYSPFCIVDAEDKPDGFSVELLQAALAAMGHDVTFRTGTWATIRSWLVHGEIQVLPLVGRTPEREALFDFTFPYMSIHGAIVVRNETTDIRQLEDLEGRTVAVMNGDNAEEFLRRKDRGIQIEATATFNEAFRGLSRGRVDAVVVQRLVGLRLIQEGGFTDLRVIDQPIKAFRQDFCFAVKKGDYETLAILNEGLALIIADGKYRHLHAKWFAGLQLPVNRRIVIGGDQNYAPFEFLDEKGQPAGFNVDLTNAIARNVGLDIEIQLGPWEQKLQQLTRGEIDATLLHYSTQRDLIFDFSPTHMVTHCVGIARKGEGEPPADAEALIGKKLVVQEGDILHDFLNEKGLTEQVSTVNSQEQALRELSEGRHDFALVSRMTALNLIKRHGWKNLSVGKKPLLSPGYGYAVSQHNKALLAQLSEGLEMTNKTGEYRQIYNKWFGVYEDSSPGLNAFLRYIAIYLAPLVLLLMTVVLWSWSLRQQVARQTAELRESENLLQIAGTLAHLGAWRAKLSENRVRWSDEVARIHKVAPGFSPSIEEMIRFYVPECREKITEVFDACAGNGASYDEEMQIITAKGNRAWVRIIGIAERDKSGRIIAVKGGLQDITEPKLAEDKLRESESRFRLIAELAPVGIVITDHPEKTVYVSQKFTEIFGYTKEEMPSAEHWWMLAYPEKKTRDRARQVWEKEVAKARTTQSEIKPLEHPVICKDGSVRHIEFRMAATDKLNVIVFTDVSEGKKAEKELRKRESLLNKIFDVLPIGLWITDKNGKLLRGNPAGVEIWGAEPAVSMEDYGIFKARRLPSGEEIAPEDWALAHTVRDGVTIKDELLEITAFDGRKKTILNYTAPVLDNSGHMLGAIVMNRDITERMQAEEDRQKLQDQLNQAQKMESVARLAGGVAHDFNNMLTIINGYAEMITEVLAPSDPMYANVREIHDAGKRSAVIVRKLLAFARKQTISPVLMSLNDNVSNMLKMLQRLIGENIDLLWKPGENLWLVKMDLAQIDQILANLAVNARDAISDVGRMTIETQNISFDEDYCANHTGFVPGQFVRLAVSDDGCGMSKEVQENLFEPFFTTKEVGKGTGLGLPTVYGIVKQNNGFINVYSEPDKGTTFRIYFPRDLGDQQPTAVKEEEILSGHGETILILEDEVEILTVTKILLEKLGYVALAASSANEAMALADTCDGKIDLLITDVIMPGTNGRDFANQLNSLYPDTKVLFMSGYTADVIAHHHVLEEEGLNFIEKPFSMKNLAVKVSEILK